jgi:hypothetical protein
MNLVCPMCKKLLEPASSPCSRCRTDLTLLVDYMSNLDEHLQKAEKAMQAGELGDAVWAYLNVLETDPEHAMARSQVTKVATAVRQFDDAKRTGRNRSFVFGAVVAAIALILLGGAFFAGYKLGGGGWSLTSSE